MQLATAIGLIVAVLSTGTVVLAQRTISEAVASGKVTGREAFFGGMAEVQPMSLEELGTSSDLVVEAELLWLRTYPSAKDDLVLTDFAIKPLRFLKGRLSNVVSTPGTVAPFVLTSRQGVLVRDGVTIRGGIHGFEDLVQGKPYLLFLTPWNASKGEYQILNYAAFQIVGGTLRSGAKDGQSAFDELLTNPYTDTVNAILALPQRRQ